MRKSTIPAAIAIVAALSLPAQAAKYTCQFYQGSNPVGPQCVIDPTTKTTSCQQSFGANLVGGCAAGKSEDDKMEALLCLFGVPASVADVTKGLFGQEPTATVHALAEKPGFAAQNYTMFPTQTRPSLGALLYRESQSSPVLSVLCQ